MPIYVKYTHCDEVIRNITVFVPFERRLFATNCK